MNHFHIVQNLITFIQKMTRVCEATILKILNRSSTNTALQTEDGRIRVEEKSNIKKNNSKSTWQDKKTCDPQGEQMNMVLVWYYHITFTIKFGSKIISTFPFSVEHHRTEQDGTVPMIAHNRDHELVTYCDIYKNWSHIELLLSLWLPKYSLKWISHILIHYFILEKKLK